jgi:hypothetical protein
MGASEFSVISVGKDADEAFTRAKEAAFYDFGHSGYTGSIAEKPSFIILPRAESIGYEEIEDRFMRDDDDWCLAHWPKRYTSSEAMAPDTFNVVEIYQDKWDDCFAVKLTDEERKSKDYINHRCPDSEAWFFFGLAST